MSCYVTVFVSSFNHLVTLSANVIKTSVCLCIHS